MNFGISLGQAVGLVAALLGAALWGPAIGAAQTPGGGQNSPRPVVRDAARTDTSVELRHMPEIPPFPAVLGEIFERPRKLLPRREGSAAPASFTDPVLQGPTAQVGAPTTGANFDGINNVNGVLPPDPSGAIGPNHYVQVVNLSLAVWDRSGNKLKGPVNINTLWQGFGGDCATTNHGDPIVLYDRVADRWMVSQFALPNYPAGPFYQCIAVSQTSDPLGAWHRYEFFISQTKLNDYPKFGVWPDGYYMAINQFHCTVSGCTWAGQGVVVFERDKMLLGQAAQMVYFDFLTTDPNLGGMLPSDFDGPPPPGGAPNYFVAMDDSAWGYSGDQLQTWEFDVDWSNPASSTFTHTQNLPTAAFDSNMCDYSGNCIPQQGTTRKVDAISDRLMYRLQYRNFGTYQTLVANHTVDVNDADRAGIRWYELRKAGSDWSIYQQGTYSLETDTAHRWMGSIAMNKLGDMALGYSKSGASVYPSIYATGRLSEDDGGVMTQAEIPIQDGSGNQTHAAGRWGDYSHMSVDPIDDCTFWYTQEYYATSGSAPWRTRIGSFRLRDCGGVHDVAVTSVTALSPVLLNSSQTVTVGLANQSTESETFNVSLTDSFAATITGSPQAVTLAAGASTTLNFGWTPTATGDHLLTATASTVPGETETADNSKSTTSTVNTPPPSVTVIAPNGGENLYVGNSFLIQWTSSSTAELASHDVLLSTDGGVTYPTVLAAGLPDSATSFNWTPAASGTGRRIKIVATDSEDIPGSDTSNSSFSVLSGTPSITVTAPNTNVNWGIGTTQTIKWTSNLGGASKVDLEVSRDSGATYSSIAAGVANTGSFPWVVTGPASTTSLVRIRRSNNPSVTDASNVNFTIANAFVRVTAPNAASVKWGIGTQQSVTWTGNLGSNERVQVLLSTDGGLAFPIVLANSVTANSSATITVPSNPTTQARVRVQWLANDSVNDMSDASFVVAEPFLTVTKPNGGENWAAGSTQTVTWSNNLGSKENVSLELSTDGGTTWQTLKTSTPSDGSQAVLLPSTVSSTACLVRVTWLENTSVNDVSNAALTISPPFITVTSPNGGENWFVGTSRAVTWQSNLGGSVKIDLSTNGGVSWQVLVASASNTGSRSVTVPNLPSTQALLRVTSLAAGFTSVSDTSNAVFSITQPVMTVLSPNGGEVWAMNTVRSIQWNSNTGGNVKIELSRNGGTTWSVLKSSVSNSGSFDWTVTAPTSTNSLVRITSLSVTVAKDTSDAGFTIQ